MSTFWILMTIFWFATGVAQHRHAIWHAKTFEYSPPIMGDVRYWYGAAAFGLLMAAVWP